jgi:trehalose 6-phosphate synthase
MSRLVIVSNRVTAPTGTAAAGGLAVALADVLRERGGIWFGWSGKIAQRSSSSPSVTTDSGVTYATVDLGQSDHHAYYSSYANGTLWPLLHYRLGLIAFDNQAFDGYLTVNRKMAAMLRKLLRPDDVIWVHDYHLIPLALAFRELGVSNRIGFFLHTPFPVAEVFCSLPRHEVLLQAMTAYDLIGLQTPNDARALTSAMERTGLLHQHASDRTCRILPLPIGIDPDQFARLAGDAARSPDASKLKDSLGGRKLIIGVDRLDYSKGLPNRFAAIAVLLTEWPEMRSSFTYLQVTPPSRSEVPEYQNLRKELESAAGRVNGKYAECDWTPIRYVNRTTPRSRLAGYLRMARVGLVTPFRDGMNLVAKEFVAAQEPADPGVLVLSKFAGAACELTSALQVNPYDTYEIASAIRQALLMPLPERRKRWESMFAAVQSNTISSWRDAFLRNLLHVAAHPDGTIVPRVA